MGFRQNIPGGFVAHMGSILYAKLMQKFVVKNFPELGFDIVMFNKKVKDVLNQNIEKISSLFLQIVTLGFRQASIGYEKEERKRGNSKWTFSKKIKLLIDSFVAFSYMPIRFVSAIGIIFSGFGFVWACYIIFRKLLYHDLTAGWPSLIAILMIGFGLTNLSLGIIAEYLWRTLDAVRHRDAFIVEDIFEYHQKISETIS